MKYTTVKCDQCGKERRDTDITGWLSVQPVPRKIVDWHCVISGLQQPRPKGEFCSPECLLKYAEELVAEAQKGGA